MGALTTRRLQEIEDAIPGMDPGDVAALAIGLIATVRNQRREIARIQRQYDEALILVEGYRRREAARMGEREV